MNKSIKIVFAGTPDFAVPFLKSLIDDADFEVIGVITQPDRPSGRKQLLVPSPVKTLAAEHNIAVMQPGKLDDNYAAELKQLTPDVLVVVAYGQIIPQAVLDVPTRGAINVHPSLLPKYRGASPIQNAILNGEAETGVSIMLMDAKMDHGPILAQEKVKLNGSETNESLHDDIANKYGEFLTKTINGYLAGDIKTQPQDDNQATFCKTITKDDARIDWSKSAEVIEKKIRAYYPWPVAWASLDSKRLKIFSAKAASETKKPGELFIKNDQLGVGCGQGSLIINELQPEGKQKMTSCDFLAGHHDIDGKILE